MRLYIVAATISMRIDATMWPVSTSTCHRHRADQFAFAMRNDQGAKRADGAGFRRGEDAAVDAAKHEQMSVTSGTILPNIFAHRQSLFSLD